MLGKIEGGRRRGRQRIRWLDGITDSGSWWWAGRPGVLQFMGLQRVRHNGATELNWTEAIPVWGLNSVSHELGNPSLLANGSKNLLSWVVLTKGIVLLQVVISLALGSFLICVYWSVLRLKLKWILCRSLKLSMCSSFLSSSALQSLANLRFQNWTLILNSVTTSFVSLLSEVIILCCLLSKLWKPLFDTFVNF